MDNQSSAQTDTGNEPQENAGVKARIDQLVAQREQEKAAREALERQLMENTAQMAQMALQAQQRNAPPAPAPVDPLQQFKDTLDPVAMQAIQAAVAETQRRMEAQFAPVLAQQAAQIAQMHVATEAANIKGLPAEVSQRAAALAADWRQKGLNLLPGDAINFALGEYQRGQLTRAAAVAGYNPALAQPGLVQGYTPAPPQQQARSLPANFDSLNRNQQNAALEQAGILDQPL
jgi:hypothetical protein